MGSRASFILAVSFLAVAFPGCEKPADRTAGKPATAPAPASPAAADQGPIKIGAIFAETGPAMFLGAPEAKTARMLADKVNAAGGIGGRKIQLILKDSGSDAKNALSLAKQLIDEEKVVAIIGPSQSGETLAIKSTCQESKTPLVSCAAAEAIVNPIASYVFKSPQTDADAARWIFKTMGELGISRVGVISGNDGFGTAGKAQLEKLAPEHKIVIAISEVYDKAEKDLTGVLTKLKAQDVQAVINWSIVPAQGLVAKNMKQIDFKVPLFQSHGFGNIKYVQASGEAANGIIFPCGRLLVADALPDGHPQKALLLEYKKDYEALYKEEASTFGGHAYDAFTILVEALGKAGPDRDKVRDALEGLRNVPGTAGVFNFSPTDHNGLSLDAFEMLTVKDGKFVIYKRK
jgi:branched-chain amino acid transport system substrate-binding protein